VVGPGSGVARVAPAREPGVGRRRRGAGCGGCARSSWWRRRRASLYSTWKRRVREKREKERAGSDILAYIHRADTSADENTQVGLYGGCGALVHRPPDEHKLHTSV
jgi:hypothetical protein